MLLPIIKIIFYCLRWKLENLMKLLIKQYKIKKVRFYNLNLSNYDILLLNRYMNLLKISIVLWNLSFNKIIWKYSNNRMEISQNFKSFNI
jgi:hypothetical protein